MNTQRKQKGVVLVIGLLMLLLITILGVSAMSTTSSNERTTGNNQFATVNFQAAESAIKSMFSRPAVEPTIMDTADSLNDKIITQTDTFDVRLDSASAAVINVATTTLAEFCGADPMQMLTSLSSGSFDMGGHETLAFDVTGDSQIGGVGAQENHLRSGGLTSKALGVAFNGTGSSGACTNP
ncbi:MAG: PilX N-terminal domain-containing pilus assembly protein [Gammaproteobacteria bacterium]